MVRSRARGEAAAWSVLPVAVVVIVVGGLFWASVWIAFSPSITAVTVRPSDLLGETAASEDESEHEAGASYEAGADADDGPVLAADEAAADEDGEGEAVDEVAEGEGEAAEGEAAERAAGAPSAELDAVMGDPVAAASAYTGPVEALDEIALGHLGIATELGIAARSGPGSLRNDVLTARAEALTARAEALTARNEELVVKIDGLTTKIEELEAKLEASGAVIAALPAAAPSPVALPRSSDPATVRSSQATQTGRSPWVVSPLPEPGNRVPSGPVALETRARGEAPIKEIRMQIDGVPVAVALEKLNETTWRGRASARVTAGSHTVSVSVVDAQGRVGSYRWKFDATPS